MFICPSSSQIKTGAALREMRGAVLRGGTQTTGSGTAVPKVKQSFCGPACSLIPGSKRCC